MSIQSEIDRIKTDKNSLITALAEKGIEVAEGATLGDISIDIEEIEVGIDTSDATASAADILSGKTAYVNDEKITGIIATKTSNDLTASGATVTVPMGYYASNASKSVSTATQAIPSITINSNGLITATATQTAGYVVAGTKNATKQLAFQAAKTITPTTVNQTAVAGGYYTGGDVVVKGDSNLVASNIKEGVSIFGVTGTHSGGSSSGGSTDVEDSLITRTITTYSNDRVTTIGNYAFLNCSSLTSVSFPKCTTIGGSVFENCSSLTSVSFPNCTTIGNYAFHNCSSLTSVSFPNCTNINGYAFKNCYSLTSVNFPKCTSINGNVFQSCSSLTSVSFPNCTSIGGYVFMDCYSLTSVSFPKCTKIGNYAFRFCSNLTTIYLGASKVCTLAASNAFSSTGIWSTTGYIYVPSSLYSSYKTATNWVFFSKRIFSYAF